jgi:hypothetical protein
LQFFRYNKWRTGTEFGLANVRARVLADVTPTGSPVVPDVAEDQTRDLGLVRKEVAEVAGTGSRPMPAKTGG